MECTSPLTAADWDAHRLKDSRQHWANPGGSARPEIEFLLRRGSCVRSEAERGRFSFERILAERAGQKKFLSDEKHRAIDWHSSRGIRNDLCSDVADAKAAVEHHTLIRTDQAAASIGVSNDVAISGHVTGQGLPSDGLGESASLLPRLIRQRIYMIVRRQGGGPFVHDKGGQNFAACSKEARLWHEVW